MKNKILTLLLFCLPMVCAAQIKESLNYSQYIKRVSENNLAYAAQKLNIPIAEAAVESAKVFSDPSLSVEYANNDDRQMMMGQGVGVELSKNFSFGKRRAGIDLAKSEKEVSVALLEDYFRRLRADATIVYLEAIKQTALFQVKQDSYNSINELANADSLKFAMGKITEVDALQSRVEAGVALNELLQASSDLVRSYAALNVPLGQFSADTLFVVQGELKPSGCDISQEELLSIAVDNRSDLVAALKNVDVAQKALKLVHRERNTDFDLSLGYNYNTEVRNELAPAPQFNGVSIGISVPLKFSNFNRGTIRSAEFKARQAQIAYQQAEIEVKTEVVQNYASFISLAKQVDRFNNGMLDRAIKVLKGKIYSYGRGETSLLEVLNAQRTYNDVQSLYIETLFNHAVSLITLEQSAGIWDITIQ